jgi:hypothetical protein
MIIRNKGYYLLTTAIFMAVLSAPAEAWYRGGGGSWSGRFGGSGSWSHSSAGGAYGGWGHSSGTYTGPHGNTADWSHSSYGAYHPQPTAVITAIAMAITPLAIAAVIVAAMSRRQVLPGWPSGQWPARPRHLNRLPLLLLLWWCNSQWRLRR